MSDGADSGPPGHGQDHHRPAAGAGLGGGQAAPGALRGG